MRPVQTPRGLRVFEQPLASFIATLTNAAVALVYAVIRACAAGGGLKFGNCMGALGPALAGNNAAPLYAQANPGMTVPTPHRDAGSQPACRPHRLKARQAGLQ